MSLCRDLLPCPYTYFFFWRSPYSLYPPRRTQKTSRKEDTEGYSSTTTATLPGCGMMSPNPKPQCHPVTRPDAIGPEQLDHVFSETRAEPSPQDHHLRREGEEQKPAEEMGEWNS